MVEAHLLAFLRCRASKISTCQSYFMPECAAAYTHKIFITWNNVVRYLLHPKLPAIIKIFLDNANCISAKAVQAKVKSSFWKISKQILSLRKISVSAIINNPEVISSSSHKAKFFPTIFAIDDKNHLVPDFPNSQRKK